MITAFIVLIVLSKVVESLTDGMNMVLLKPIILIPMVYSIKMLPPF